MEGNIDTMPILEHITSFLIDIDGVLYSGNSPVKGAKEAIDFLEDNGYKFRFVSNSTRKCRASIAEKLHRMNFDIPTHVILTPAVVAAQWITHRKFKKAFLLSSGDVHRDFDGIVELTEPGNADVVIIGDAGDNFTYSTLTRVFRCILDNLDMIALERDRYWMGSAGLMLSAGPFVAALEFATGKKAELVGKPSKEFFRHALQDIGASPFKTAMIGDDIISDIGGAKTCGMVGILVKTGKYRENSILHSGIHPDYVIDSLAILPTMLQ